MPSESSSFRQSRSYSPSQTSSRQKMRSMPISLSTSQLRRVSKRSS